MKVEIKFHLLAAAVHRHHSSFLAPLLLRTDNQRNLFFDAFACPLFSANTALHIRLYGLEDHALSRRCSAQASPSHRRMRQQNRSATAFVPPLPPAPFHHGAHLVLRVTDPGSVIRMVTGGPHGAPGDFVGEKGGAPAEFQPSFRSGGGSWPAFGRARGSFME